MLKVAYTRSGREAKLIVMDRKDQTDDAEDQREEQPRCHQKEKPKKKETRKSWRKADQTEVEVKTALG